MTDKYLQIVDNFEKKVAFWQSEYPQLKESISSINKTEKNRTKYDVVNSLVFNTDLREIGKKDTEVLLEFLQKKDMDLDNRF